MARKKANNRMLVILLALIAVVCVALWYADKVEREGKAAAAAEQPADEAAEAAAATLAGEGTEAPDFTVEMIDGSKGRAVRAREGLNEPSDNERQRLSHAANSAAAQTQRSRAARAEAGSPDLVR